MDQSIFSARALSRRLCRIAAVLCCIVVAEATATGLSVRANDPSVIKSWTDEFDSLSSGLSHGALNKQAIDAFSVAANTQSCLFGSDRTPLDVIVRRTAALLADIKRMPGAADMSGYERRLSDIRVQQSGLAKSAATGAQKDLFLQAALLRRSIAFANPLLDFDTLIFHRWTSHYGHVQEACGNTTISGGGLFMLTGLKSGQINIRNMLTNITFTSGKYQGRKILDFKGCLRSWDLSYDAKRIVFAWTPYTFENTNGNIWPPNNQDSCKLHVCVMNIDGTGLKILSDGKYNDLDPAWLPNGRIVYVSTRPQLTVRCNFGPYAPQAMLYSMKDDGSDVIRLSYHETNERYPSVDNNGKIMYMRWDYIDRDMCAGHHIWHCYPDGRDPRSWHGNYGEPNECLWNKPDLRTQHPFAEYFFRAIPGSQKIATLASSHHTPSYGLPIILDLNVKDDNKVAQVKLLTPGGLPWPAEPSNYNKRGLWQGCGYISVKNDYAYFDPWPLSETYFLIPWGTIGSEMYAPQMGAMQENYTRIQMKLYLLDAFGNKELVNDCSSGTLGAPGGYYLTARPFRPRPVPPNIPTQTYEGERAGVPEHKRATISILNVKNSDFTWPANVNVTKMRIVQVFPRHWEEPNVEDPKTGWSEGGICRASLGTVPVESDGSVYCEAPVDRGLLFQLLDDKGRAVTTMRSLTYVHKGENLTCAGCHEDKWKVTPGTTPLALKRAPSPLFKEVGSQVPISFGLVSPIFQNKCLPCHKSQAKGLQDFSYNAEPQYPDTNGKTWLSDYCWWYDATNSGDCLGPYGGLRSQPYKFGFYKTRLGRTLTASHTTRITADEMQKIMLWCDLNCMKLANPTHNQADIQAQTNGGSFVWPVEMLQSNPTGIETDRDVPTAIAILDQWRNRGFVTDREAAQRRMIRFANRNVCEITGVQGYARVSVVSLAGRTIWSRTFDSRDKEAVYRFSFSAFGRRNASELLFVNVVTRNEKQTERFVCLGNR